MANMKLKSGWKVWRFDQMATNVNVRIDNPSESGMEHYVGLEHLDPDSLRIRRWGSPDDVEATKLMFKKGDIIFGRRRAYQRKLGVAEFDGICSAHAMVLRAKPEVVLPEFLPFFMQSDLFMNRAVEISVGSLSPTINWKTMAAQEFTLPSINEQIRLISVVGAIRNVAESYDVLINRARRLLRTAVRDRLETLELAPQHPITTLGIEGVDVFRTGPFGSNLKSSYFIQEGVPVLSIGSLGEDGIIEDELFYLSDEHAARFEEYRVKVGDIVFSRVADVGRCHLISAKDKCYIISSNLIRIRVNPERMLPGYLILMLKHSRIIRDHIARLTTQAAGRLLVNTKTLAKLNFPVPSLQEQCSLVELEADLQRNIDQIRTHQTETYNQLGLIRDKLLLGVR